MYLDDTDLAGFRARRDELFGTHPQSPIADRAGFRGLLSFPPTPDFTAEVDLRPADGEIDIDTGGEDGVVHYTRVGILDTPWGPLSLWWIAAYGGGLFLPVRDGTCGVESYGGGRVRLDMNYLYNPSCAYDDRWLCPLAPPENRVTSHIASGEQSYH